MTHSQTLTNAEIAADRADERYFAAFDINEHPSTLEMLATEAHLATIRYEELLLADAAESV